MPFAPHETAALLGDRREEAVLVGEAKWSRTVNAARIVRELELKTRALPRLAPDIRYAVCARERVTKLPARAIPVTASDIFA